MEENYLVGLFVFFLLGFVLFKKDNETTVDISKKEYTSHRDNSGATGVAKYLKNQQDAVIQSKVTGVEKYLQDKQLLEIESTENSAISSVAKYLANKADAPVSGVSKYMARQAVQAKKMAKENVSGVEKYLNSRG